MGGHGWIDSKRFLLEETWVVMLEKIDGVFERVHGGQWYGVRNELGDTILDFATIYTLRGLCSVIFPWKII